MEFGDFSTYAVILSEQSESKDLLCLLHSTVKSPERSFDFVPFGHYAQDDTLWKDSQLLTVNY